MAKSNRDAVRDYRRTHPEIYRRWRVNNRERAAKYTRKLNLKKKGFSLDAYSVVRAIQGEMCAICKSEFASMESRRIHADHCHRTSLARGVLCHECNTALGLFRDNPEIMLSAISYLNQPPMKEFTMIENHINELKAAIEANTAAIKALLASSAGAEKPKAEKPTKTEAAKPKHTREELDTVLATFKDKFGVEKVKGLIKEVGGVEKKADIPDSKLDAVVIAAKDKIKAAEDDDV